MKKKKRNPKKEKPGLVQGAIRGITEAQAEKLSQTFGGLRESAESRLKPKDDGNKS